MQISYGLDNYPKLKDAATRLLLWLSFTLLIFFTAYQPAIRKQSFNHPYVTAAIRAANLGYPFSFAFSTQTASQEEIQRFSEPLYIELGLPVLVSATSIAGRFFFGGDFQLDDRTPYKILLVLFMLTALVFVSPGVPLPVAVGGLAAFYMCIMGKPAFFSEGHWGATYGALLTAMLIAVATFPKKRAALFTLVGLGILGGLARLIREESVLAIYGGTAALLAMTLLLTATAYFGASRDRVWLQRAKRFTGRVSLSVGLFLGIVLITPMVLRGIFSLAWHTPYWSTPVPSHGSGHSPYLGLGYVNNPYNIAWDDNVGAMQVQTFAPGLLYGLPRYQETMRREWLRLSAENPRLVRENIIAKALNVRKRLYQLIFFLALPIALIAVTQALRKRSRELGGILAGFAGLFLASLISPLLVYPTYTTALYGTLMAVFLILPGVFIAWNTRPMSEETWQYNKLNARHVAWTAIVTLLVVAGLAGLAAFWYQGRERARQQAVAGLSHAVDPLAELPAMEYRFGYLFNQLPLQQQETITTLLQKPSATRVYRLTGDYNKSLDEFRPVVALLTENQLHLIVWLGSNQDPALSRHGDVAYYLTVCAECDSLPASLLYDRGRVLSYGINDLFWKDQRYRFYSFAIDPNLRQARWLQVGAQKIVGSGPGGFGYGLETKASARLDLSEGLKSPPAE